MSHPCFELCKYLGKWYELAHGESWFESSCSYNTTAEYTLKSDGNVHVCNKTWENGKEILSNGTAHPLSEKNMFHVHFEMPEQAKVSEFFGTIPNNAMGDMHSPNYIVHKIWCWDGHYKIALVTNEDKSNFWVLSRDPHLSARLYGEVMCYVSEVFGCKNVRQTPHYKC